MTFDPPSIKVEQLQQLLRSKTAALLVRDRELHDLTDRHKRALGWLDAVDGLSNHETSGEVSSILHAWPRVIAKATGIQYACVCRVEALTLQAVAHFGARPLPLDGEFLSRPITTGEVGNVDKGAPGPFTSDMPLSRFLWGAVKAPGGATILLITGYDHKKAAFFSAFDASDVRYMQMMCQYLASTVGLESSLSALQKEQQDLIGANASLVRRDRELSLVNEQLEHQSQQLQRAYTKLELTHTQLVHNERLAAIGSLAASVAHEINNPATYVLANLNDLIDDDLGDRPLETVLRESAEGVQQIVRIMKELRLYARRDREPFASIDPATLISSVLRIAHGRIRHIAEVEVQLDTERLLWGDRSQLAQVLLNLVLNAADAMRSDDVSKNTIRIIATDDDSHILLRVVDNGSGIEPAALNKIFDSFFTTKALGDGDWPWIEHRARDRPGPRRLDQCDK